MKLSNFFFHASFFSVMFCTFCTLPKHSTKSAKVQRCRVDGLLCSVQLLCTVSLPVLSPKGWAGRGQRFGGAFGKAEINKLIFERFHSSPLYVIVLQFFEFCAFFPFWGCEIKWANEIIANFDKFVGTSEKVNLSNFLRTKEFSFAFSFF